MINAIEEYEKVKIKGLNYVREVKVERTVQNGKSTKIEIVTGGYLIINKDNKPIKNAYNFIRYRKTRNGDSLNTIKRKCYDLCAFFDFMMVNKIDEELLDYEYLYNFATEYLPRLNPKPKFRDCIERSMLKEIPVLPQYKSNKIKGFEKSNDGGLDTEGIVRILNIVKQYLVWLKMVMFVNVNLDDIFTLVNVPVLRGVNDSLLNHLEVNQVMKMYSVTALLKNAKIEFKSERISPVGADWVFDDVESVKFFEVLKDGYNPSYQLLFYLLSITGLRISEALALKINGSFEGKGLNFNNKDYDIYIENEAENIWKIKVVVRKDNPPDLCIKFNKSRVINFTDNTNTMSNLMKQLIIYRTHLMKSKRKKHDFLFVNSYGNRLRYQITKQTFDEILEKANLSERTGLVIHSFRHSFASEWIRTNKLSKTDVELLALSEYLGHSSIKVTQKTYIHFFRKDIEIMLGKMEKSMHCRSTVNG